MRLRLGNPRHVLVIAPHPDDEVIGAGLLIHSLRQRGVQVSVLVVSDGSASHAGSMRWPRTRLVVERKRETKRAMKRLRVVASQISFLGFPDSNLTGVAEQCRRAVQREIARRPHLDLVIGPALDDDHPDHRTVAAAMMRSRCSARQLAYRVWPPSSGSEGIRHVIANRSSQVSKRSLILGYRTQCGAIKDNGQGFCISRSELAAFSRPIECFIEVRK